MGRTLAGNSYRLTWSSCQATPSAGPLSEPRFRPLASKPASREPGQLYGSMPAAAGNSHTLGLSRLQCSRKAWSRMG
jgi:hypothetical protein